MLKRTLTIAAVCFALGLSAQVRVQKVATKDQAVFTVQPTRIVVENSNANAATKAEFTAPAMQHVAGNSQKQTPRTNEVFGVEPRRTKPTK
ncbi:MAG: hypothetical protein M0D57_00450 [Sphingobacteriales bacterium JAD_PAG50586_3]|nr:MAG: hypothetical protein M0D57_00450 [Sphingobacteriales bacterium JAD_PAG50586_3]